MANEKRLIDANEFLAYIDKQYCQPCKAQGQDYHEIRCRACWVDDMQCELDGIPTVDAVEVVHAKWKVECKDRKKCSNCGFGRNTETQLGWNFCPRCGARMDLEE